MHDPQTDATSAISIATDRGYDDMVRALQEGERKRERDGPTVDEVPAGLRNALAAGDEDATIRTLQEHPALVRFQLPANRWTLLHVAAAALMQRLALWLINAGADYSGSRRRRLDRGRRRRKPVLRRRQAAANARARGGAMKVLGTLRSASCRDARRHRGAAGVAGAVHSSLQDDRARAAPARRRCRSHRFLVELLLDLGLDPVDARARVDGLRRVDRVHVGLGSQ